MQRKTKNQKRNKTALIKYAKFCKKTGTFGQVYETVKYELQSTQTTKQSRHTP